MARNAPAVGNPAIKAVRPSTLDEAERVIDAMPLTVERLSTEWTPMAFVTALLGPYGLVVGDFGSAIHSKGAAEPGQALVGLQMAPSDGHWNGERLHVQSAWFYPPGAEHEGVGRNAVTFAALAFPHEQAERLTQPDVTSRRRVLSGPAVDRLRLVVRDVADAGTRSEMSAPALVNASREVGACLAQVLQSEQAPGHMYAPTARRIVEQCLDPTAPLGPRPSSQELARVSGVTDRRIRAAFNEVFGVSVGHYLRVRALHGAHRDLTRGTPAVTSVTDVAMHWGFWHLGRFSGQYRRLFAEHPSRTLRRTGP